MTVVDLVHEMLNQWQREEMFCVGYYCQLGCLSAAEPLRIRFTLIDARMLWDIPRAHYPSSLVPPSYPLPWTPTHLAVRPGKHTSP